MCTSLAVVDLTLGSITYVPGVCLVYIIKTGTRRDELIYVRRTDSGPARYPFIHADKAGRPIAEVSDEWGGNDDEMPTLRAYLRKIGGTITFDARTLP